MKKLLLFILPPILASIIVFGATILIANSFKGKGALQVTSNPSSKVYLNGKYIGTTPFCKCDLPQLLPTGDYIIKLVPEGFDPFEQKITITKSVITVIERVFGKDADAQGSVINLSPLENKEGVEMFVTSFPDNAKVFIDKTASGQTPLLIKSITPSDHELTIDKDGYVRSTLHIHTVKGYKLEAVVYLAIRLTLSSGSQATPSAVISPSVSPIPSVTQVTILQTPTGFLRVRADASISASETARISPGQTFPFLSEKDGWYQIKLNDGSLGWISNQYAQKQ